MAAVYSVEQFSINMSDVPQFENLEGEQRATVARTIEECPNFDRGTRALYKRLIKTYPELALDTKKNQLLVAACEARQRQIGATKRIDKLGTVMIDARGIERPRPEVEIERKYLEIWIRALQSILPDKKIVAEIRDNSIGSRVRLNGKHR